MFKFFISISVFLLGGAVFAAQEMPLQLTAQGRSAGASHLTTVVVSRMNVAGVDQDFLTEAGFIAGQFAQQFGNPYVRPMDGLFGVAMKKDECNMTLVTVWRDNTAMRGFADSGAHSGAKMAFEDLNEGQKAIAELKVTVSNKTMGEVPAYTTQLLSE